MLGNSALGQLALAEFPQKPQVSGVSSYQDTIALLDTTDAAKKSPINPTGHICVQFISPPLIAGNMTPAQLPCIEVVQAVVIEDTHDGVRKRKKKKKLDFAEELERTAKIRKDIVEVIHPPVLVPLEEPEAKPIPEVVETKQFDVKTSITPAVDYADLARQEIVDKIRQDAELRARQLQERIQAEIDEEEEELEMILDSIL